MVGWDNVPETREECKSLTRAADVHLLVRDEVDVLYHIIFGDRDVAAIGQEFYGG